LALEKLGMKKEAEELYKKVAGLKIRDPEFLYYKALALQYLEEDGAADALAEEIGKAGEEKISRSGGVDFFSKFGEGQSGKARESGGHWCIYPMYDYAHPLSDAFERITH
jgi:hypothetical protein